MYPVSGLPGYHSGDEHICVSCFFLELRSVYIPQPLCRYGLLDGPNSADMLFHLIQPIFWRRVSRIQRPVCNMEFFFGEVLRNPKSISTFRCRQRLSPL